MSKPRSNAELETIITRAADQHDWTVFSEDPRVIRHMTKAFGVGWPSGSWGQEWTISSKSLVMRKPRVATEAQRAVLKKAQEASKEKREREKA